ncbi:MAG: glycosyltransferase family 39 protein [Chloroflexi bacterium]|nr:glycosyltransferase family 39 protein [Chloroflexota bacterium]
MQRRQVGEFEWTGTILGIALLFGTFVRVLPAFLSGFPINDGGMFLVMMRDLRDSGFALPMYTTYNHLDIPYAYPPLGFYLGGVLELSGIPSLWILTWLPAIFTTLTIPLFYLLAKQLMGDRPRAALATTFFAFAPGNYVWLLMGGGLTRALGTLFFLSALIFTLRTFQTPSWRTTGLALISCSLVVLSHPQMAFLTALSCAVFGVFLIRSRSAVLHAFVIGAGTLLLTSPWWGTVLARHGVEPFLSAGQSGNLSASLKALWGNLLSLQTILPFATFFRWLGLGWAIYRRRFDLLVWGFLPYFIDQRSASIVTSFLYPVLAAYGFLDVLPAFVDFLRTRKWNSNNDFMNRQLLSMSLLGILFYLVIECFVHAYVIRNATLPPASHEMTSWVRDNTPADSRFLILTGRPDAMTDPLQEWFPALAGRHSATTLQGLEWTLGGKFYSRWDELSALQSCRDMACVDDMTTHLGIEYDYVILDMSQTTSELSAPFLEEEYVQVYGNGQYVVLKK